MDTLTLSTWSPLVSCLLKPAMLSVQLASKDIGTDDYSQQMLSFDSALVALFESVELLEGAAEYGSLRDSPADAWQPLADLGKMIAKFSALQEAARDNFNLRARSLRKDKVGILDLPNELLRDIFKNFRRDLKSQHFQPEWDFGSESYRADTAAIQNVRLAHPRFLEHASPLLVRYLDVSPTKSSLERLENIMRHPEISRGQRLLRVDLRYYKTSTAEDLTEFALMCRRKMQIVTESLERALKESKDVRTTTRIWSQLPAIRQTPSQDGVSEDGVSEDGVSEDGVSEEGVSEDDVSEDGGSEDDVSEDGLSEGGVSEDGLSEDGVSEDGVSDDGVSEDDVSEDGVPEDVPLQNVVPEDISFEDDEDDEVSGLIRDTGNVILKYAAVEDGALEDMVAKAQRILSSWDALANGAATDEEDAHLEEAALALRRGHERYRALQKEQNELVRGGHFVQAVAAAMARGHSGGQRNLWLYMSDDEGMRHYVHSPARETPFNPKYLADPDLMVRSHMIRPSPWFSYGADEAEGAPQWLLYQLPLAMHAAGVALTGLKVVITRPSTFDLNMSQGQLSGLRDAAENLEIFEFDVEENPLQFNPRDSPETLAGFYAYISAAMGRQGVPTLSLAVKPQFKPWFRLRPLLTSVSWQRLERVSFERISMRIQDLKRLVRMLQPGVCLQLSATRLKSGTWAAALDCLRSKAHHFDSYVQDSLGAECNGMGDEDYDSIFALHHDESRPGCHGTATRYIRSEIPKNPLREDGVAIEATPQV